MSISKTNPAGTLSIRRPMAGKSIACQSAAAVMLGLCLSFNPVQAATIGGVVFQSDTFMQTLQDGMQAAADEAGADLILGNSETDLARETEILSDLIVREIDALVISPFAADGSVSAVGEVVDAAIPIVCVNTCLNETSRDGVSSFLATQNVDLGLTTGRAAATYIADNLNGEAVIGILNCDTFPEACLPRKEGFLSALDDAGISYEVAADQTGFIADQALPIAEAMLQANPNINVLWGANEGGTTAHVLAVQTSGLSGEVAVFGTDMSAQHAQFLQAENGPLQAVTGQAPFQMGYDAVNAALAVLESGEVPGESNVPTILFNRGDDEAIDTFVETNGRAVFASK